MLSRVWVVALNTYREAVRARILLGLFGLAVATAGYSLVVATYTLKSSLRVLSDLASMSASFYAVVVAIVMGASSLYRELEQKTLFPILARPLWRAEYLVGKVVGTLLTLTVFLAANAGVVFCCLGIKADDSWRPAAILLASLSIFGAGWFRPWLRTWLPMIWAGGLFVVGYWLASSAPADRQVVVSSVALALMEVAIVVAIATFFSSFSSPFLTAVFTLAVFLVGRSADTLAKLPERVFGATIHELGVVLSKIFPNLMVYVPPRPLLLGQVAEAPFPSYAAWAALQSGLWVVGLLAAAAWLFRRRDFT